MTHPTAAITAYWNAAADRFDTEPDHGLRPPDTRAAWAERLASWLPDTPSDVLDVGCGTGSLAELAARAGHRVTGVDLAPRMVGAARAKLAAAGLPGRFLTGDAGSLPLGRVRKVSPAWRRPARSPKLFEQGGPPLAAPAEHPRTTSTRASVRHAESTHRTPPGPPYGRTTRLCGHALDPEERFDVLLSRHLVWTLPDPQAALADWVGRLRPGGRLILVEGRWREAGAAPYVTGADALPWHGGVTATDLADAVRPLVTDLRVEPLAADPALWGGPVTDERYALLAHR